MQIPELSEVTLGYMPLLDCAAFVIAAEKNLYHEQGLHVNLQQEPSWANIRDKVAFGVLDGAQMLAATPVAMTLGVSPMKIPMVTGFSMGLNGNAITFSNSIYEQLEQLSPELHEKPQHSALALKNLIKQRTLEGRPPLAIAQVYNYSSHNYLLRYWLASAGINPDEDVRIIVVPPQMMAGRLAGGEIDGFCAGEPWNTLALEENIGRVLISGAEIWNRAPEKVLGVTRDWARQYPHTHLALIKALYKASQWLDDPSNTLEAAEILSTTSTIPLSSAQIYRSMTGSTLAAQLPFVHSDDISIAFRHSANLPKTSHAVWFIEQMYRWGYLDSAMDMQAAAEEIYKPEIYTLALTELSVSDGLLVPDARSWSMDESVFSMSIKDVVHHLNTQSVHKRRVDMALVQRLNGL